MLANQSSGSFDPVPEGQHLAYCFGVIGLGLQTVEYDGKAKKQPKVRLMFVLPEVMEERDGKEEPRITSKAYTLSLHDKSTLALHLQNWRGKGISEEEKKTYDLYERLEQPAIITVIHKAGKDGKTRGTITNVAAIPAFMTRNGPLTPNPMKPVKYDISDGKNEVFNRLSKFMQEAILNSEEIAGPTASKPAAAPQAAPAPTATHAAPAAAPVPQDDIPF